jgi:hypothetical protein
MQKKERKNKKSNNLTSNLLQKETHTHTKHTEIEVKNEKDKQKKKRDLESCGVVTQIEKAKRIFAKSERNNEIDFDLFSCASL